MTVFKKLKRLAFDLQGYSDFTSTIGIILLIIALFVGIKFGWVLQKHLRLANTVEALCNWDHENLPGPLPLDRIEQRILSEAKNLGLKINRDNIKIKQEIKAVYIEISYVQPVNLIVYTYNWKLYISKETREELKDKEFRL